MPSLTAWSLSALAVVAILLAARALFPSLSPRSHKSNGPPKSALSRSFCVIIPTLNETTALPNTISHLFSRAAIQDRSKLSSITVIVVDASQDISPTRSCLTSLLATHKDSLHLVQYSGKPSRGLQMNFGADYSAKVAPDASILVFLHADTYLPHKWDDSVFEILSESARLPLLGCFKLSLPPPVSPSLRTMLWFANKRASWGHLPYGDQCYFITRSDFDLLGHFPGVPIMEDVGMLRRVSQHGGKVEVLDAAVETSKRRWEKNGVMWNTILNQFFITAWLCGTPPETIYSWYYGRRKKSD